MRICWFDFLRKLAWRGLRGVELVVSDAHEGLKAAVAKVLNASWSALPRALHERRAGQCRQAGPQRCAGLIGTAFAQDDAEAVRTQWRQVAD